jgi:hypothetical protein
VWSGLAGTEGATANFTPTFIYVAFWLGFVPISVLFGDVFRAFNPWLAIGRASGWLFKRSFGDAVPEPMPYPVRLGRWPAAIGIFAFAWLELASSSGDRPSTLAVATLIYSAIQLVAMSLYGAERWAEHGEAFGVYFNLFSRVSPVERRGRQIGLRRPLSGLAHLRAVPGTVALLAVMIGTVSFDGLSGGGTYTSISPDIVSVFTDLGFEEARALELTYGLSMAAVVLLTYGFYRLGIAGVASVGKRGGARTLSRAFAPSLAPIALAYVAAHYVSLLMFQGQAMAALASDPLGDGSDFFGTAGWTVDYTFIGANTFWYLQLGFVLIGHAAGLALAHDRALVLYRNPKLAIRSQYWMLAVMIGFTSLALWLLSEANKG